MKFLIWNRGQAETLVPHQHHILISICEPHKEYAQLPDNENRKGLLQLKYTDEDDIECARQIGQEHLLMTDDQAQQVLDFVDKYKDHIDLIVCQCDGGICRSSGTAAALSHILNGDDTWVFDPKGPYIPNRYVYRKILNLFYSD